MSAIETVIQLLREEISTAEDVISRCRQALDILEPRAASASIVAPVTALKTESVFDVGTCLIRFFKKGKNFFRENFDAVLLQEKTYYEFLEERRWKDGIYCPHCGSKKEHYSVAKRGRNARQCKYYRCSMKSCHLPFSVKTGTILDNTKISLHRWFLSAYLIANNPDITTIELGKVVQTTQKTAWYIKYKLTNQQ